MISKESLKTRLMSFQESIEHPFLRNWFLESQAKIIQPTLKFTMKIKFRIRQHLMHYRMYILIVCWISESKCLELYNDG